MNSPIIAAIITTVGGIIAALIVAFFAHRRKKSKHPDISQEASAISAGHDVIWSGGDTYITQFKETSLELPKEAIDDISQDDKATLDVISDVILPFGQVTLLLTDIEESTRMAMSLGTARYLAQMKSHHDEILRSAFLRHGGHVFSDTGDGFFVAFQQSNSALACAVEVQRAITTSGLNATDDGGREWELRVRIGVHTSAEHLQPEPAGNYHHAEVNFAARIGSLANSGQIVASEPCYAAHGTGEYVWKKWPNRRIKSFDRPEVVWELLWDDQRMSRGEPGSRWFPEWYLGESNRYIHRYEFEKAILEQFGRLQPDGSTSRLVTIHGSGGMGKTRLAIACAIQVAGLFKDGVFFVRLEDASASAEGVTQAIAIALGLGSQGAAPHMLIEALREKDALFVLDNYESVSGRITAAFLANLLAQTRHLCLLVTGRETVKLNSVEQVIDLEQGLSRDEGTELFTARSQLKKRGWNPSREDHDDLERILDLTQGIPLAIELSAAWRDKRTVKEIANAIKDTPMLSMPPGCYSSVARHASLTRCLDWSFNLLSPDTQETFAQLGVFADSFTVTTVACVWRIDQAKAQSLLDRLQDAALVIRLEIGSKSRYTMHRPTRSFAAEKLTAQASAVETRQAFVVTFKDLVCGGCTEKIDVLVQRKILEDEWINAARAIGLAKDLKDQESVIQLVSCSTGAMLFLGLWAECERLNKMAIASAREIGNRAEEANALRDLADVYHEQGEQAEAEACYRQSLKLYTEAPDRLAEARTLKALGWSCFAQNRLLEAEEFARKSLQIYKELSDHHQFEPLSDLGSILRMQGKKTEAEAAFKESLAIVMELHDEMAQARVLNNLGDFYRAEDRSVEAEESLQRSLVVERELGDKVMEGKTLFNLSLLKEAQGDIPGAIQFGLNSVAVLKQTEEREILARAREKIVDWKKQV